MDKPKRKTIQHFNLARHAHLLTFSCFQQRPLLESEKWKVWLAEGMNRTFEQKTFTVIAYVFMPEHIHLLIYPAFDTYDISTLLSAFKRPFSYKVKMDLTQAGDPLLDSLTVRDRPNSTKFRFWQEGPGHDRNLESAENCITAAGYIHNNPVKRGLCKSADCWKWSSWKYYNDPTQYNLDGTLLRVHGMPG